MRSPRIQYGLFGLAVVGLLAAASTVATIRDNFNDNTINATLWKTHRYGTLSVHETNGRLEFSALAGSGDSHAGLEVKSWGANWRNDFEISLDYKFTVANVTGTRGALIGVGMVLGGTYPETMTGYQACILRGAGGLFLWVAHYVNGEYQSGDSLPITQTQGTLLVEWSRDGDEITVATDPGGGSVHLTGPWAQYGATKGDKPMVISIGCSTYRGNNPIVASRARADKFYFWGVKKARP